MKLIKNNLCIPIKFFFFLILTSFSLNPSSTSAQINMELGGGFVQIHGYGPVFQKARYTIAFPDMLLNDKLGFFFTLESTGNPKYSKPLDNWGVTYRVHPNISVFYGHSLFNMQTKHPEFFPFTGRQDLGFSFNPNNFPINVKVGYGFYVGPTFQITCKVLDKKGRDSDNDGIRNRFDKCTHTDPRYVGWVNNQGCVIDTDGDEVPDIIDSCKTIMGTSMAFGCPDQDKDLVADHQDKCPQTPGLAAFYGCPASQDSLAFIDSTTLLKPTITTFKPTDAKLAEILNDATPQFVYDNYSLLPHFQKKLVPVVAYLKKNPMAELILIGHTDAVGTEEYNVKLSLNRALEVKKYIVFKGISPNRISTFGNGTSSPLFNDNSETARMANRRVELIIK